MNGNPVSSAWGIMKLNLMTLHYLIAGLSHGLMEPWGKCGKAAYQYAWRENISRSSRSCKASQHPRVSLGSLLNWDQCIVVHAQR
jgi:hypothetical protein